MLFVALSLPIVAQNARLAEESKPVVFSGYGYTGTMIMNGYLGRAEEVSIGIKIEQRVHLGIETGYHYYFMRVINGESLKFKFVYDDYIPIGLNLKALFTRNCFVVPFFSASMGGYVGCISKAQNSGLYCQLGAGVNIFRFSFSVGYLGRKAINNPALSPHSGYFKVGCYF